MARSTVFRSNRSQARLPKSVAFPDWVREVEVLRIGTARVVTPLGRRWDEFFADGSPRASDDFISERDQPPVQNRCSF